MSDLLRLDYINSLGQLFTSDGFPVHDIDVQSGLFRIDVCGMLDVRKILGEVYFFDACGTIIFCESLFIDSDATPPAEPCT